MEGILLDKKFYTTGIIDTFDSFIWTDRFNQYGDFELYIPADMILSLPFNEGDYIISKDSDRMMIIEDIDITSTHDVGTMLTISGRSLESIIERHIIWGAKTLTGNLQNAIKSILNENVINPNNPKRKIPNLIFKDSTDPAITSLTIDIQLYGDGVYDAISYICKEKNIGFRILPGDNGEFIFELYAGLDKSYSQEERPYVVFSPEFENLLSSNYFESKRAYKTVALTVGNVEGNDYLMEVSLVDEEGLERRELFLEYGEQWTSNSEITLQTYYAQMREFALQELAQTKTTSSFEGEIDATRQFIYGKDFFLGDIVQVVNDYGMEAKSRVSEIIHKHDQEGEAFIPTFEVVDDNS